MVPAAAVDDTQSATQLNTGTVPDYWFTYEKSGPQFDTPHFTYTHGAAGTVASSTRSMPSASIQAQLDTDFNNQKDTLSAQFANGRVAHLFKPGTYDVIHDDAGFYTSVAGLGQNPTQVRINGDVTVDAFNASDQGVALQLFPASFGFAGGGYIADSRISGQTASVSQQQWYTRDANLGSWNGGVWNMVFSGTTGAPANTFPSPLGNHGGHDPISRDVPYLYLDGSEGSGVLPPAQLGRNDQLRAVQRLQPVLHPGHLALQPDAQRDPGQHRGARHRLPDPGAGQRGQRDAGRRRGRGPAQGPALRRRHHQLGPRC